MAEADGRVRGARRQEPADRRRRQAVLDAARARHGGPRLRVRVAESVADGLAAVEDERAGLRGDRHAAGDGNGLDVIARLKERRPEARGVILTGYGNIATAVTAVKLGAFDYLAKPADADEIHAALMAQPGERAAAARKPDVGRPGALGAHPARLRAVRPQRLGDGAPPQHAPPHPAAHPGQARAAVIDRPP